eukprot:GHVU01058189.1.p1 GENE.GHVU01058189.1~~GHVU01058189.1.p1  ORF type:complete len:277 (+),score=50.47 GHVU01058189.1:613-1443(+)
MKYSFGFVRFVLAACLYSSSCLTTYAFMSPLRIQASLSRFAIMPTDPLGCRIPHVRLRLDDELLVGSAASDVTPALPIELSTLDLPTIGAADIRYTLITFDADSTREFAAHECRHKFLLVEWAAATLQGGVGGAGSAGRRRRRRTRTKAAAAGASSSKSSDSSIAADPSTARPTDSPHAAGSAAPSHGGSTVVQFVDLPVQQQLQIQERASNLDGSQHLTVRTAAAGDNDEDRGSLHGAAQRTPARTGGRYGDSRNPSSVKDPPTGRCARCGIGYR